MSTQLNLSQAAQQLKVSEKSIRRYIKSGKIKAVLIKGERGHEYRINKDLLKVFNKPPRGKNSHQGIKKLIKQENKKTYNQKINPPSLKLRKTKKIIKSAKSTAKKKKLTQQFNNKEIDIPIAPKIDSISDILEQKIQSNLGYLNLKNQRENNIDYKLLYERLLAKYEQALIMIGSLEAQNSNYRPQNNTKIESLEEDLAKQEDMILGLYQDLRLYKENPFGDI